MTGLNASAAESSAKEDMDFRKIWSLVETTSPSLQAVRQEAQALEIAQARAASHWLPRVFAGGRAFATNDPGASFQYSLQQRQIGMADFVPASLNEPGSAAFEQLTLGLDLPLYEGGMRSAQAQAAKKGAEAKNWEAKAIWLKEYARAGENYAALLVLGEQNQQLKTLKDHVSGVLENYTIGSKSNPVGYSGLLGLKNLRNRVEGLLAENEAKISAKTNDLRAMASEIPMNWQPKPEQTRPFLARTFTQPQTENAPAAVLAARSGAEALEFAKDGEKARFLPRLGAFAQGDLYHGSRATATSYTSGVYLQWELFSAPNIGAVNQAGLQAAAAQARTVELQRKMQADHATALAAASATEKNLSLLDESAALLEEQTRTARNLFRNGSINALQLVEVLNRRADLLVHRADAQLSFAQLKAALFLTSAQ
jgi:outer membrane protein TolC